jgi:hypothetical protein
MFSKTTVSVDLTDRDILNLAFALRDAATRAYIDQRLVTASAYNALAGAARVADREARRPRGAGCSDRPRAIEAVLMTLKRCDRRRSLDPPSIQSRVRPSCRDISGED